jgi:nucleoside-diphosphate-sugar epimerase
MVSKLETILVCGATSQVGVFALPALLAAGYPVLALSRKTRLETGRADEPGTNRLNWLHPDTVLKPAGRSKDAGQGRRLGEVGVLLSCGPVELAARMVSACSSLRRVVCMSTSSVHTKGNSTDAVERMLIDGIIEAERDLSRSCEERGITLALLRPTLIYGCGMDQNVSRIARLIRRFHFFPLAGEAGGLRQPVHAADLAGLALKLVQAENLRSLASPVGGGNVLTYRQMVERVFAANGLAPRTISITPSLLVGLFKALAWLPAMHGVNSGFFLRQNLDQVFDDGALRELVNYNPRPFEPTIADFSIPGYARAVQPR